MKVAVLGSTGFVGSYLIPSLLDRGYLPKTLVRKGSESKLVRSKECRIISGDLSSETSIAELLKGSDAVIYNIGIIREFPKQGISFEKMHFQGLKTCLDLALKHKVKRFILMSANGVKPYGTKYQTTKYRAEEYLKKSALDWTIFRPSLIFGDGNGRTEFCSSLYQNILRPPIPMPFFFQGVHPNKANQFALMTPIHVQNVADFFVKSIEQTDSIGQTISLGGNEIFGWKKILKTICQVVEKKKIGVPVPIALVLPLVSVLSFLFPLPVSKEQLVMLQENNLAESLQHFQSFGIKPIPFTKENLTYLKKLL